MNVEERQQLERLYAAWEGLLTAHERLGPASESAEDVAGYVVVWSTLVEKVNECGAQLRVGAA